MFRMAAEQAAPSWVPVVALAVPVTIMLLLGVWAVRGRRRTARVRRSHAGRATTSHAIADPSAHTVEAVLDALAGSPEAEDAPYDETGGGARLGLKAKVSHSTDVMEPHLIWGTRAGRQVFVRMGPDEKLEGGTTLFSNRHNRTITVLRVVAPVFDVGVGDGFWRIGDGTPAAVEEAFARLAPDDTTWGDALVVGGPDGIVIARSTVDAIGFAWPYDLWLAEHLATVLGLEPCPPARIGPKWKVPYRLGRDLEPTR